MPYTYILPIEIPDDCVVDTIQQDGLYTQTINVKVSLKHNKPYARILDYISETAYEYFLEKIDNNLVEGTRMIVGSLHFEYDGHGWVTKYTGQ